MGRGRMTATYPRATAQDHARICSVAAEQIDAFASIAGGILFTFRQSMRDLNLQAASMADYEVFLELETLFDVIREKAEQIGTSAVAVEAGAPQEAPS